MLIHSVLSVWSVAENCQVFFAISSVQTSRWIWRNTSNTPRNYHKDPAQRTNSVPTTFRKFETKIEKIRTQHLTPPAFSTQIVSSFIVRAKTVLRDLKYYNPRTLNIQSKGALSICPAKCRSNFILRYEFPAGILQINVVSSVAAVVWDDPFNYCALPL